MKCYRIFLDEFQFLRVIQSQLISKIFFLHDRIWKLPSFLNNEKNMLGKTIQYLLNEGPTFLFTSHCDYNYNR